MALRNSPRRAEKPTGAFRRMSPAGFAAPCVGGQAATYRVWLPLMRRKAPAKDAGFSALLGLHARIAPEVASSNKSLNAVVMVKMAE